MRKSVKVLGIALLLTLMASFLYAAEQQGQQGGRGGQQGGQRGQQGGQQGQQGGQRGSFDPAAMQDRMLDIYKERLGATDEEWVVIKPRLAEVIKYSQNTRSTRGMGGRGNRGGQQTTETPTDPVQIAVTELQQTLEKEAPTAAEIKAKLIALRGAREKNKQQLIVAQQKLKEVLSVKQEALLVMMSMLE